MAINIELASYMPVYLSALKLTRFLINFKVSGIASSMQLSNQGGRLLWCFLIPLPCIGCMPLWHSIYPVLFQWAFSNFRPIQPPPNNYVLDTYFEGSLVSLLSLALSFSRFSSWAKDSGRDVSSFLDRSMEVSRSQVGGTEN